MVSGPRAYALLPSTTTVASSVNPSSFGSSVTFTATVSGLGLTPTGTVTFMDGATTLGSATLNSGGANFSTTALSTGNHSITAVYGGDTIYNSSTSAVLTQTVVANSTSTSITSSANPSALEQSVIFTATVTSSGGTPTGTVTFMDGSTTLGMSTLNGSGQATFATTVLTPGNHSITANYSGDANFSAGSSPVLTQTVNLGTSTTAVTSSANPSSFGQAVTFTATVSGLIIEPTGTVTFMDGATTLGTGNLNASGQATFTTSTLSAGSHSITAVYGGDSYYNSSTSNLLTQTVNADSSTTTLSSSSNPSASGASVTFTATVAGAGATPTGTVTFKDGGATLGSGTLNGSGQATFSTSSLSVGTHSITAVYGGDSNYSGSTSPVLTQTVTANSSSTAISSSVNPSTFGQSVTFTATVSGTGGTPTGTVTFKDGAATLGTGTLNGSGQTTFSTTSLTTGSHSITANYGGDSNFASSVSAVLTQTVNQSSSTTGVTSSLNPSTYGAVVTFTATVSGVGGTPTGTVTFKDGATTLGSGTLNGSGQTTLSVNSLSVGSHSITAAYSGDANFPASTSPVLTQNVTGSSSATAVTSSVNPSAYGQTVTFTATVTGAGGTPTGTVTFKDGATTLGSGTLNGSGQTTLSVNLLSVGSHSISASYGGDSNFPASTSSVLTQTVTANSSATVVTSSVNPSAFGQSVTFTATVTSSGGTPTGTVTFKDGTTTLGSATLNGSGEAAFSTSTLAAGSHSITASYSGDGDFGSGVSPTLTQTVSQSSSGTGLTSSPNPSAYGATVTFMATVSGSGGTPTGTVTFKDGATTVGSAQLNGNGQASLSLSSLSVGSHSITASYSGDGNFPGSTSPAVTQTVAQNAAAISLTSSVNPSALGQPVTFTAVVTGPGGTPSGTVTFKDGSTVIGTATLVGSSATFTISSLAEGNHSIVGVYGGDGNFAGVTSSVLTQSVDTPADSIKLHDLQVAATQVAAQASGQAISGSIESAISDGFSDQCSPLAPTATGVHVNLCPERNSKKIVDGDFAAFSQSSPPRDWLVWADIRGTELTTSGTNDSVEGRQVNALVGVTRRLTPDVLLGAFGGYEFFDYTIASLDGRLQGDGWTAGGYFGWRFLPGLRFEAGASYSGIDFDGMAGTASGSFTGNRMLATAGFTGTYKFSNTLEIDPSVRVYDLWEQESAYTDSLGTTQAERTFSTGRASVGAKAIYYWRTSEDLILAPYAGLYADYYFSNDSALSTSPASTPLLDGLSARVVSGVTLKAAYGAQFTLGGELGGIGGEFTMWTFRAAASVPF